MSTALSDFGTCMTNMIGIVTDNAVLYTMLAGGLIAVAARVFKRIKKAVR